MPLEYIDDPMKGTGHRKPIKGRRLTELLDVLSTNPELCRAFVFSDTKSPEPKRRLVLEFNPDRLKEAGWSGQFA